MPFKGPVYAEQSVAIGTCGLGGGEVGNGGNFGLGGGGDGRGDGLGGSIGGLGGVVVPCAHPVVDSNPSVPTRLHPFFKPCLDTPMSNLY